MSGEIEKHDEAYRIAAEITKGLQLDGNLCFDFIVEKEKAWLLEVNPRINATLPFCSKAGANLAYLRCLQMLGYNVTQPDVKYGLKMKKYYESEYYL